MGSVVFARGGVLGRSRPNRPGWMRNDSSERPRSAGECTVALLGGA